MLRSLVQWCQNALAEPEPVPETPAPPQPSPDPLQLAWQMVGALVRNPATEWQSTETDFTCEMRCAQGDVRAKFTFRTKGRTISFLQVFVGGQELTLPPLGERLHVSAAGEAVREWFFGLLDGRQRAEAVGQLRLLTQAADRVAEAHERAGTGAVFFNREEYRCAREEVRGQDVLRHG